MNRFYRTFESKRVSEICKFEDIRDISKAPHCETFLSRRGFFLLPCKYYVDIIHSNARFVHHSLSFFKVLLNQHS